MSGEVICAVDGPERGYAVARLGSRLARALETKPLLAHVVSPVVPPAAVPGVTAEGERRMMVSARRMLEGIARDLELEDEGRLTVERGDPADALIALGRRQGASLLVSSSRGRSRVSRALLGSVCARLGREAPCAICVLPVDRGRSGGGLRAPVRIVCGIDGSPEAHEAARTAATIAAGESGELLLANVIAGINQAPRPITAAPGVPPPVGSRPAHHEQIRRARFERAATLLANAKEELPLRVNSEPAVVTESPSLTRSISWPGAVART